MYYRWQDSSLITLHNFDERVSEVRLDLKLKSDHKLIDLWAIDENVADENGIHRIRLNAYGYRWFRSGDLNHLLQKHNGKTRKKK